MPSRTIKVDHLYRVEGHGGIRVEVDGKKLLDVKMEIFEGSRFFEALIQPVVFFSVAEPEFFRY